MRTRRLLLALLVALGLFAAACSDSKDDGGAIATDGDSSSTTAAGADAAGTPIKFVPLEPGAVTFEALDKGDVDMALLFSTQGVIAEKHWVVLDDDMTLQGSDNIVPLIRKDKADETVSKTLNEVSAALDTAGMTELNRRVDTDHEDTATVAKDYLDQKGLLSGAAASGKGSITVGSANFSEAEIVAQMYKLALEHAGYKVTLKAQLGAREVLYPALTSGQIDVEPDYVQSLLTYLDKSAKPVSPEDGVAAIKEKADPSLTVLDPSPAQDQNAIVVTKATADKYHLTKVSDLKDVQDQLKMAGPPECPERPLCIPGYEGVYGLQFDV
jgi:osmoprotectant transport system substrate-binding protein